jgi:hypothetical protein
MLLHEGKRADIVRGDVFPVILQYGDLNFIVDSLLPMSLKMVSCQII